MSAQQRAGVEDLIVQIKQCHSERRYAYVPRLRRKISDCEQAGETPPLGARDFLRALEEESIEAMFENMPV